MYLYIPPQSDHPPGVMKSLVYCVLRICKKRTAEEESARLKSIIKDCNNDEHCYRVKINKVKKECYDAYSFVVDPEKALWENSKDVLTNTLATIYFDTPSTKGYHNLGNFLGAPPGAADLLGMGNKCVIQKPTANPKIKKVLAHFTQDECLKYLFAGEEGNNEDYVKRLCIKSSIVSPLANNKVEQCLKLFQE